MPVTALAAPAAAAKTQLPAPFWPVVGLGVLAGIRSASAPTLLSYYLRRHPAQSLQHSPLRLLARPWASGLLTAYAASEFYLDKQPTSPDRTAAQPLISRIATASLAGAAWYKANNRSAASGAVVGSIATVAATYLTLLLRKGVSKKAGLPVAAVGVAGDLLMWGAGLALLRHLTPPAPPRG